MPVEIVGNGVDDACNGWTDELGFGVPVHDVATLVRTGPIPQSMGVALDIGEDGDGQTWLLTGGHGAYYAPGHVVGERVPLGGGWEFSVEQALPNALAGFPDALSVADWPAPFVVSDDGKGLRLYRHGSNLDSERAAWSTLVGLGRVDVDTVDVTMDGIDDLLVPDGLSFLVAAGPLPRTDDISAAVTLEVTATTAQNFAYKIGQTGDLTGDGVPELTAYGEEDAIGGRAWVIPGGLTGVVAIEDVGWGIDGHIPEGEAGYEIALGDVTGDGALDLLTGAPLANGRSGVSYLYPGPITGNGLLADGVAQFDGTFANDWCGVEVAISPDQDGDGMAEPIIACPFDSYLGNPLPGRVELYAGATVGGQMSALDASAVYVGATPWDRLGLTLATADLDADGVVDLAIAAPMADDEVPDGGAVYVVTGPWW